MFQTINGVQIREQNETKALTNLQEKRFEIEYLDNVYLNKLICIDIINMPVKGHVRKYGFRRLKDFGRMWMYVVKHHDFVENRKLYGEVCSIIHDKIGEYLDEEYGLSPIGTFLIDSMDRVYSLS